MSNDGIRPHKHRTAAEAEQDRALALAADPPLTTVRIPPTPDKQDVALGHPDLTIQPAPLRRFWLNRTQDFTGLSGTGIVAEGVEFSDGVCVVRWLAAGVSISNRERGVQPTTVIHPDILSIEALHGHNGATEILWVDA